MILDDGLIALLLNENGIVRGVSSQTTFNEQIMQPAQSAHSDPRFTKLHAHAHHWIQHPCRKHYDCARAVVHVDDTPTATLFAISKANLTPIKRMPAIVNL
jgi:hypothetical protein